VVSDLNIVQRLRNAYKVRDCKNELGPADNRSKVRIVARTGKSEGNIGAGNER
jgi:hypothetical protein